jgi:hypothetical protein
VRAVVVVQTYTVLVGVDAVRERQSDPGIRHGAATVAAGSVAFREHRQRVVTCREHPALGWWQGVGARIVDDGVQQAAADAPERRSVARQQDPRSHGHTEEGRVVELEGAGVRCLERDVELDGDFGVGPPSGVPDRGIDLGRRARLDVSGRKLRGDRGGTDDRLRTVAVVARDAQCSGVRS